MSGHNDLRCAGLQVPDMYPHEPPKVLCATKVRIYRC
jgi:ubiquitin-protein ligase